MPMKLVKCASNKSAENLVIMERGRGKPWVVGLTLTKTIQNNLFFQFSAACGGFLGQKLMNLPTKAMAADGSGELWMWKTGDVWMFGFIS